MDKWLALIVMLLGLALYLAPFEGKAAKLNGVGQILFFVGMLVLLWPYSHKIL